MCCAANWLLDGNDAPQLCGTASDAGYSYDVST